MRPVRTSRPRRGPRERTSSDPNRRIFRVLPAARPSAARWKMVSTIRRASAPVTPPWQLRTVAARSALFNVETRSFLLLQGGEDVGNCTAVGGGGCAGWRGRRTRRWRAGTGTPDLLPFCQGGRRAAGGCSVSGGKCRPGEIGMGGGFGLRGPAGREAISPGLGKRGATAAVVRRPRRRGARFPHFPPAHFEDPFFLGGVAQAASLSRESFGS